MDVKVHECSPDKRKPIPTDESGLGFGKIFSDHFFNMNYASITASLFLRA